MSALDVDRLVAAGYAHAYDAVVDGFAPYEALSGEIVALLRRSAPATDARRLRVLDVACGTGSLARRLARAGFEVLGCDPVERLVRVARAKSARLAGVTFEHRDLARSPLRGERVDAVVSLHTLYWHDDPDALLAACRAALPPGGHAVFLTYTRRADVIATFRSVRARGSVGDAVRALRWLIPTAVFEALRRCRRRYVSAEAFEVALARAGFEVLEARDTFLAGISRLAWVRAVNA